MKRCSKCGQEKELGEFGKRTSAKDGLNEWCKECVCESSNGYRKRNLEKVRKANREQRAEIRKKDPGRYRETNRKWREGNREKISELRKKKYRENRFKQALLSSKVLAKRHGHYPCDATEEEIKAAFTGRCFICGTSELDCFKHLAMDHDHNRKTENFRGWLCSKHNIGLGLFGDSEELLIDALHYLMKGRVETT